MQNWNGVHVRECAQYNCKSMTRVVCTTVTWLLRADASCMQLLQTRIQTRRHFTALRSAAPFWFSIFRKSEFGRKQEKGIWCARIKWIFPPNMFWFHTVDILSMCTYRTVLARGTTAHFSSNVYLQFGIFLASSNENHTTGINFAKNPHRIFRDRTYLWLVCMHPAKHQRSILFQFAFIIHILQCSPSETICWLWGRWLAPLDSQSIWILRLNIRHSDAPKVAKVIVDFGFCLCMPPDEKGHVCICPCMNPVAP